MKKTSRVIGFFFFLLFAMFWVIGIWQSITGDDEYIESDDEQYVDENIACNEFINERNRVDGTIERNIQRSWMAYYYDNVYCANYQADQQYQRAAENFRSKLRVYWDGNYVGFWNSVYGYLYRHDADKLTLLQDTLRNIAIRDSLTKSDFAFLIVSFVQDIPYEFVIQDVCKGSEHRPCNGNVLFGIYSPTEFIYSLKGDCDTRTLLLYALLENLGFDAVIFNSYEYAHSMLGINLPYAGDHKRYRGRNFYFWETTNVGWMPGVIPPDWGNIDYWEVVLD
jgi:hypothetical protein